MKRVFEHLDKRSRELACEPLFGYLRGVDVGPYERLRFVPWAAYLVMTIGDLYRSFLITGQPQDQYERLAERNMAEEAVHCNWYITDLRRLGLDPTMRFTDALRFLWGEATVKTRNVGYGICQLSAELHSMHRLVMVYAIEATSRVMLEALMPAGVEIEGNTDCPLAYLGRRHFQAEREHTLEDEGVQAGLRAVALDEETRAQLITVVDRIFSLFSGFVDNLFDVVQAGSIFEETVRQLETSAQGPALTTE
jgi:hypothetical protein